MIQKKGITCEGIADGVFKLIGCGTVIYMASYYFGQWMGWL